MKSISHIRISLGLLILPLLLTMAPVRAAAQTSSSDEISLLLTEARSLAVQAEDDAATLEAYSRSKLTWQSHASRLEQIKEHVNALGKVDRQLNDMRGFGSSWQQKAIAEVHPLLEQTANELTYTINHLTESRSQIHMMPYKNHANDLYDHASRTAELISDYVEYERAKAKADYLQQKLQLATASQG
jgi:hypothetical protein